MPPVAPLQFGKSPEAIVSTLKEAEAAGTLSLGIVESAIFAANDRGDWALVMEIYGAYAKQHLYSAERCEKSGFFEKLLTIMMKCGGQVHITLLVNDAYSAGCAPKDSTLTFILEELSKKGELSIMTAILDQVSRFKGAVVSNRAYMALLNACDRAKAYDAMLDLYYSKMDCSMLDFVAVGVLLKACDRLRRSDAAVEVLEALLDTYAADERHFGAMPESIAERVTAILVRDGAGELAVRMLLQLELWQRGGDDGDGGDDEAVAQDGGDGMNEEDLIGIVGKLISTYEASHDLGRDSEARGDRGTYLNIAYEDLDPVEKGTIQLLGTDNAMEEEREPSQEVDEEARRERAQEAEFKAAFGLVLELNAAPVCSQRIYAGVIAALSKAGRAEECRRLLESYVSRGGQPSEEMFTSSIYAHRYSQNVAAAGEILASLKEARSTDVTIASYNAFLLVLSVSGELAGRQEGLLREIDEAGLHLNRESYTALIMGASPSQRSALWREMVVGKAIVPTIASVKEVLKHADGDLSLEILAYLWALPSPEKTVAPKASSKDVRSRRRARGGPPVRVGARVKAPSKPKGPLRWEAAKQAQAHAQAQTGEQRQLVRPRYEIQKLQPSVEICNLALASLAAEHRSEDCLALLNRMRGKEIEPSPRSYRTAVASFSEQSSDWTSAIQLLIQVQSRALLGGCLAPALRAAVRSCRNGGRWDLIKKLLAQASLAERFQLAPSMVEDAVLAAFHEGEDEAWLRSTLKRRRTANEGEEEPVLCPESLVGQGQSEGLRGFLAKASIDVQIIQGRHNVD